MSSPLQIPQACAQDRVNKRAEVVQVWVVYEECRAQTYSAKGGRIMGIYVMLTNLTDEGRKTIRENPERIREVNKEVEAMGVKVLAQYVLMGPYDFLNIIEAPSNETVAKMTVELGARGTLEILTVPAISLDDFINAVKR